MKSKLTLHWDAPRASTKKIEMVYIPWFSARGMRRVYGRDDRWANHHALSMDIWIDRVERLRARFSSRSRLVDCCSLELVGVVTGTIPIRKPDEPFSDSWIPRSLREEYENWVISEF